MQTPFDFTAFRNLVMAFLAKYSDGDHRLGCELGVSAGTTRRWAQGVTAPHPFLARQVIEYLKKELEV